MLGEATFDRCYAYLRDNKKRRKAAQAAAGAADAHGAPVPSEAEQERVVKGWLQPEQYTAYGHITSLLFCEELLQKM